MSQVIMSKSAILSAIQDATRVEATITFEGSPDAFDFSPQSDGLGFISADQDTKLTAPMLATVLDYYSKQGNLHTLTLTYPTHTQYIDGAHNV